MTDRSNTAGNSGQATGKPFVKGDPRINRKGRPRSFDALRKLAQSIADEVARSADGQQIEIDGHLVTQAEAVMRSLIKSNPERFIEIAYGKVPTPIEMSGDVVTRVVIEYADSHSQPAAPASGPADDQGE